MLSQPDASRTRPRPVSRRTAAITALGDALPDAVVANADVAARIGVDSVWIERRTGIRSRRRAATGQRVCDLAADAARSALSASGLDPEDLDLVLVATLSPDDLTPNTAPQVATAIGATSAGAIDIGAACTGFVSALAMGAGAIEADRADHVIVIGAEVLSRFVDAHDRRTAGLFGDGAGAVVLSAGDGAAAGIGPVVLGSDGAAASLIRATHDVQLIRMDGHETYKLAVSALVACTLEAVAGAEVELDEIDLFVYHQSNGRMLTAVGDALGVPGERILDVIGDLGNTSAASIPLALAEASRRGLLRSGDRVLLGAVGAGFTWGATVVEWGRA